MADRSDIILENYEVSSRIGFLPDKPPLARLPHPYYARWEETVSRVAPSRGDGRARDHIDEMPLLSTGTLRTLPEWHRAYTLLSILSQIYIWDGDEPSNVRVSLWNCLRPIYAPNTIYRESQCRLHLPCSQPRSILALTRVPRLLASASGTSDQLGGTA